jgi:hypothetical protein
MASVLAAFEAYAGSAAVLVDELEPDDERYLATNQLRLRKKIGFVLQDLEFK